MSKTSRGIYKGKVCLFFPEGAIMPFLRRSERWTAAAKRWLCTELVKIECVNSGSAWKSGTRP